MENLDLATNEIEITDLTPIFELPRLKNFPYMWSMWGHPFTSGLDSENLKILNDTFLEFQQQFTSKGINLTWSGNPNLSR